MSGASLQRGVVQCDDILTPAFLPPVSWLLAIGLSGPCGHLRSQTSTRRFFSLPSGVLLSATGANAARWLGPPGICPISPGIVPLWVIKTRSDYRIGSLDRLRGSISRYDVR